MKFLFTGIRRRTKELRAAAAVTFLSALFLCGILLIQNVMNEYIMEQNRNYYGDWILCTYGDKIDHPYLKQEGFMTVSGAEILNADGEGLSMELHIGCVDDTITDFGRLELYEGHFPEKDDEIVMDRQSLEAFGYSYELGQEIAVCYVKQKASSFENLPEIRETRTYTLSGVVRSFASTWISRPPEIIYPEILVTENELNRNYPEPVRYRFYQLDPKYRDLNMKEFAAAFVNAVTIDNRYLYDHELWGDPKLLRRVTIMMILIAVCAISCLLSSYTDGRKKTYYRLRSMGMSGRKLRRLILSECGYACAPAAAAGIISGYLLAFLTSSILSLAGGYRSFFRPEGKTLLIQCAVIFGTITVSVLFVMFRMNGRRISAGTKDYGKKELRILGRIAKKEKNPEERLLYRQSAVHPAASVSAAFLAVLITGLLLGSAWPMMKSVDYDIPEYRGMNDFFIDFQGPEVYPCPEVSAIPMNPFCGITEEEKESLQETFGIRKVRAEMTDSSYHFILWDGMEKSAVLNENYMESELAMNPEYDPSASELYEIDPIRKGAYYCPFLYPDNAEMKHIMKKLFPGSWTEENFERWKKGEILYVGVNTEVVDLMTGERYSAEENTLRTGDRVTVMNVQPEELCGKEIVRFENMITAKQRQKYRIPNASFIVFASEAFLGELEEIEGQTRKLNSVYVDFDVKASYEATDKKVADFAASHGATQYGSRREDKQRILNVEILQIFSTYGTLFLMTFFIYLLLVRYFTGLRTEREIFSLRKLKQLGMTDEKLIRMIRRTEIKRHLWVLAGLIPGIFLIWLWNVLQLLTEQKANAAAGMEPVTFGSMILGRDSSNPYLYGIDNILFYHGEWYILIVLLLIFAAVTAVGTVCAVRKVKKEVLTHE